jgi:DNA-binding transcriptional LysR family regulator
MLRQMLQDEFGVELSRYAQTNSTNTQLLMVRARHGVAIVPDLVQESRDDGLVRYEMTRGELTSYAMLRLHTNANPSAQLLMEFD